MFRNCFVIRLTRSSTATDEESDEIDDDIADSSDTETENDTQEATSPPETPGPNTYSHDRSNSENESARQPHSASVAAQRGLTVSITAAANGRRTSGLPASPRPRGARDGQSPQSPMTVPANSSR